MINTTKSVEKTKKMIAEISNIETLKWVGVALGIHAVVIVAFSISDIRNMISPPALAALPEDAPIASTQPASAPSGSARASPSGSAAPKAKGDLDPNEEKLLNDRKDSPVVKNIKDTIKPKDAPTQPANGGFDLDEK